MASQMSGTSGALNLPPDDSADAQHALDLIRSAVALLAAGGATRVTLVGLRLDGPGLREARSLVRANGMSMRVMTGHVGCDMTVEASG